MKDFYFKIQVNISSSVIEIHEDDIAMAIEDYIERRKGISVDAEVYSIRKKDYYG